MPSRPGNNTPRRESDSMFIFTETNPQVADTVSYLEWFSQFMLPQELGILHDRSKATPHSEFLVLPSDMTQFPPPEATPSAHVHVTETPTDSNSPSKKLTRCEICGHRFKRRQERTRHLSEVHEPKRRCPFKPCTYSWKRPNKIKAHITNVHGSRLCPSVTKGLRALRGKDVIEFVDAYEFKRPDSTYEFPPLPLLSPVAPSGGSESGPYLSDYCECRLERIEVASSEDVVEQIVEGATA